MQDSNRNADTLLAPDRIEQHLIYHRTLRRSLAANSARLAHMSAEVAQSSAALWNGLTDTLPAPRRVPLPARKPPTELQVLTSREIAVLKLIAEGFSSKEIAYKLDITFKTACCHRFNLMRKLGVREAATLVRIAIRCGLVEP